MATLNLTERDIDALARIAHAEAGNQSIKGRNSVAAVVINRVIADTGGFKNTIPGVIAQRAKNSKGKWTYQFEPMSKGKGKTKYTQLPKAPASTKKAIRDFAKGYVEGRYPDPTNGATFFQNVDTTNKRKSNFADGDKGRTTKIGDHTFYNQIKGGYPVPVPKLGGPDFEQLGTNVSVPAARPDPKSVTPSPIVDSPVDQPTSYSGAGASAPNMLGTPAELTNFSAEDIVPVGEVWNAIENLSGAPAAALSGAKQAAGDIYKANTSNTSSVVPPDFALSSGLDKGSIAPMKYTNQGATRNKPIDQGLYNDIQQAVNMTYGPGHRVEINSGGQAKIGSGGRRTGTTAHDEGFAADIKVFDENGKQLRRDELAPLAQNWKAAYGGRVGLEMGPKGGGIHLDQHAVRGKRGPFWEYDKPGSSVGMTPGQWRAVREGAKGVYNFSAREAPLPKIGGRQAALDAIRAEANPTPPRPENSVPSVLTPEEQEVFNTPEEVDQSASGMMSPPINPGNATTRGAMRPPAVEAAGAPTVDNAPPIPGSLIGSPGNATTRGAMRPAQVEAAGAPTIDNPPPGPGSLNVGAPGNATTRGAIPPPQVEAAGAPTVDNPPPIPGSLIGSPGNATTRGAAPPPAVEAAGAPTEDDPPVGSERPVIVHDGRVSDNVIDIAQDQFVDHQALPNSLRFGSRAVRSALAEASRQKYEEGLTPPADINPFEQYRQDELRDALNDHYERTIDDFNKKVPMPNDVPSVLTQEEQAVFNTPGEVDQAGSAFVTPAPAPQEPTRAEQEMAETLRQQAEMRRDFYDGAMRTQGPYESGSTPAPAPTVEGPVEAPVEPVSEFDRMGVPSAYEDLQRRSMGPPSVLSPQEQSVFGMGMPSAYEDIQRNQSGWVLGDAAGVEGRPSYNPAYQDQGLRPHSGSWYEASRPSQAVLDRQGVQFMDAYSGGPTFNTAALQDFKRMGQESLASRPDSSSYPEISGVQRDIPVYERDTWSDLRDNSTVPAPSYSPPTTASLGGFQDVSYEQPRSSYYDRGVGDITRSDVSYQTVGASGDPVNTMGAVTGVYDVPDMDFDWGVPAAPAPAPAPKKRSLTPTKPVPTTISTDVVGDGPVETGPRKSSWVRDTSGITGGRVPIMDEAWDLNQQKELARAAHPGTPGFFTRMQDKMLLGGVKSPRGRSFGRGIGTLVGGIPGSVIGANIGNALGAWSRDNYTGMHSGGMPNWGNGTFVGGASAVDRSRERNPFGYSVAGNSVRSRDSDTGWTSVTNFLGGPGDTRTTIQGESTIANRNSGGDPLSRAIDSWW